MILQMDRPQGQDGRAAMEALEVTRYELQTVIGLCNNVLSDTAYHQALTLAPVVWRDIDLSLETLLATLRDRLAPPPAPIPETLDGSQPRQVQCRVCMDRVPNLALRSCGHVLCKECGSRIVICPFCRKPIIGTMTLYF